MKHHIVTFLISLIIIPSLDAQSPYRNGLGLTLGQLNGISYKTFPHQNIAIHSGLGVYVYKPIILDVIEPHWQFHLNLLYQNKIKGEHLQWFAGIGMIGGLFESKHYRMHSISMGTGIDIIYSCPEKFLVRKIGATAIAGFEYSFSTVPISLLFHFEYSMTNYITDKMAVSYGNFISLYPEVIITTNEFYGNFSIWRDSFGFSFTMLYTFRQKK